MGTADLSRQNDGLLRAAAERERDRLTAEAKAAIARGVGRDYVSDFEDADWKFVVVELPLVARQLPEG